MTRRLVLAMTSLVAVVALALAIPMAIVVATDQRAAFVAGLETDTLATASVLSSQPPIDWQTTVEDVAARTGARAVVVDTDRRLLADSDDSGLDRSFDRPEVDDALGGVVASNVRYSNTLATNLRYVAAPIVQNYQVVAAVRLSLPEYDVDDEIAGTLGWLGVFVISVIVAAGLVAWLLARSIAAPLTRLADVAESLPDDLERRADENSGPPEVRKAASALNYTALRLTNILARTQRVAADASHHLRTPLTGVRLRLEAIEETTADPDIANDAGEAIAEVDRLTHRIDQVLALARTDAGTTDVFETNVPRVVRERVQAVESIARGRGLVVDFEGSEDREDFLIKAPVGVIERIVDELLGNALDYARHRVVVGIASTRSSVIVTVSDDGPGVSEAELDAIFERFSRGSTAIPGGTGLGLALVRESAIALGGDARASRAATGGLEVRVSLPRE